MTNITLETIRKTAVLARLHLTDDEAARAAADLRNIFDHLELLNEADTEGIEPLTCVTDEVNHFRDDVVVPSLDRQAVMDNAPQTDGECYLVPQVLE